MFTLFSPSIALHNQHGRPNVEERESVCIDFYHELARGVKLGGGIASVSLIWLPLLASRPDPSIQDGLEPLAEPGVGGSINTVALSGPIQASRPGLLIVASTQNCLPLVMTLGRQYLHCNVD